MRRPAGYSACMRSSAARSSPSSAVSTVRRSVRRTLRGVRTLGWVLLGWSHRHSVALWWRSIVREVRGGTSFRRMVMLLRSLARVSADTRLANAAELKSLSISGGALGARAEVRWSHSGVLRTVLEGVDDVERVDVAPVA